MFERISKQIIAHLRIQSVFVALGGSRFTNDYAGEHYSKIRSVQEKLHQSVYRNDVDSRIVLCM